MELITAAAQVYVPNFLPGFEVLYIDATDGQRVTPEQEQAMQKAGITIQLGDSMPDILLWNQKTDALWVVEAVTSDGEVDSHKVQGLTALGPALRKEDHRLHHRLHDLEGRRDPAGQTQEHRPRHLHLDPRGRREAVQRRDV